MKNNSSKIDNLELSSLEENSRVLNNLKELSYYIGHTGASVSVVSQDSKSVTIDESMQGLYAIVGQTQQSNNSIVLNVSEVNVLNASEVNLLNESEVNVLNESEVNVLNASEVNVLNESEVNASEVSVLNELEVNVLNASEVNVLNASEVNVLNASEVNASIESVFYVNPIGNSGSSLKKLMYNDTNKEIIYSASAKTLVIEQINDNEKLLVRACLEGSEVGIYYRGESEITNNHSVEIELPNYVDELCIELTVQLTPIYNGDNSNLTLYTSKVENNKFTVYSSNNIKFYWIVHGRCNRINIELLKEN